MRGIKFRAWHNGHKHAPAQMLYDEKPGDCLLWKSQGQNIEQLMQYTGLKDRNGKEVCEGDIFKSGKSIGQVKWEPGWIYVDWFHNPESWSDSIRFHTERSEVIGNIYENPDLLPKASESNESAQ